MVYLPYPIHLKPASAKKLIEYVEEGGILVSEGMPGYFGDRGKVGVVQPNLGLDRLFGAKESDVEFTPDLLEKLTFQVRGAPISGRYFRQEFDAAGGEIVGRYANGKPAAIEHRLGKGRVLLLGSFPGGGYFLHHTEGTKAFFAGLLPWAGIRQKVSVNAPEIKARLHQGPGGTYLWVLNPSRSPQKVSIRLDRETGPFTRGRDTWQKSNAVKITGQQVEVSVEDRNAAVIELLP
jgi:beta-galactosidase